MPQACCHSLHGGAGLNCWLRVLVLAATCWGPSRSGWLGGCGLVVLVICCSGAGCGAVDSFIVCTMSLSSCKPLQVSRSRLQQASGAPALIARCCRFALLAFVRGPSSCWRERLLLLLSLQGFVVARKCCLDRCISFLFPPSQASIFVCLPDRLIKENMVFCVFQQVEAAIMDGMLEQLCSCGSKLGAVRFAS